MFDRKSDYSLNKKDTTAIVYIDADKHIIRLTREDFASEEEFQNWKTWSDADYHDTEKRNHFQDNHTVSMEELGANSISVHGVDAMLEAKHDRLEKMQHDADLVRQIKSKLSETQFRRLWMFHVGGMTMREIAKEEGVSFQCVHKSIAAAKKKIFVFFKKQGDKRPE